MRRALNKASYSSALRCFPTAEIFLSVRERASHALRIIDFESDTRGNVRILAFTQMKHFGHDDGARLHRGAMPARFVSCSS